jgi:Mg/Co/Ni transporter MgtE
VYDYASGKQDWIAAGLPSEGQDAERPRAGTVARRDAPTCRLDERMSDVRERIRATEWDVCMVLNDERVVLGILLREALDAEDDSSVEEAMRPGPGTFRPNVPIEEMAEYMIRHDRQNVPITTSGGRLVGVLVQEDAVRAAHALHASEGHRDG